MELQVLDIGYRHDYDGTPIISIYGNTVDGVPKTVDVVGFEPYFYVQCSSEHLDNVKIGLSRKGLRYEEVERFKPIGYQSMPTKMLKVTTISPKDVRFLRDEVRLIEGVDEVYEADILFNSRFMADTNITGMSWIDVPNQYIDYRDIKKSEMSGDVPLRILSLDIECLSPEDGGFPTAEKDPIILVSLAFSHLYRNVKDMVIIAKGIECVRPDTYAVSSEAALLKMLRNIIHEYNPDVLTGYNIVEFDFPYIERRMQLNNMTCNFGRNGSNWFIRSVAGKVEVSVVGRVVIDTLPMIRKNFSLKEYKLKTVARELLHFEKLDVPAKVMREYWFDEGEKFIQFVKYSRRDAVLALLLITDLGMLQKYIALSRVSGILLQTVISGGQSVMLEFMLLQRFNRKNRLMGMKPIISISEDDNKTQYEGAFVSPPEVGLHENLILTDMVSLYPSIIIANNLCPSTVIINEKCSKTHFDPNGGEFADADVCPGILPAMLDEVLKQRLAIKKQMKGKEGQERATLDAIQYALKIVINSAYGWTGYKRSRLFNITTASAVTAYGRETIDYVSKTLNNIKDLKANNKTFNFHVAYNDTDSAYTKIICDDEISLSDANAAGEMAAKIVSEPMPYPMRLNYEGFAKRAIFFSKKRYAMLLWEEDKEGKVKEKMKVKGIELVRRDASPVVGNTMQRVLDLILKEGKVGEASEHVREVIDKVQNIDVNSEFIGELELTRNYHKGPDAYKNKPPHMKLIERMIKRGDQIPGLGDRISFYIVGGHDDFSERAETLEYIREHHKQIDTKYYLEKQLIPPLRRIFDALDVDMMTGKKFKKAVSLDKFEDRGVEIIVPKRKKRGLDAFF